MLDEFVYDPDIETGTLILNATKGVFRLVGGKISKKSVVVLNTPTASIGIRGGIALISIADNGTVQATFLFGESLVMESGGVTKKVTRPGYFVDRPRRAPRLAIRRPPRRRCWRTRWSSSRRESRRSLSMPTPDRRRKPGRRNRWSPMRKWSTRACRNSARRTSHGKSIERA